MDGDQSQMASEAGDTHAKFGGDPYVGPGVAMETKLMKQYRLGSPVHAGLQGAAVRNKDGQVELFTIGTDGTVWNFAPEKNSSTAYRLVDTKLKGDFIAAGVDHGGSIVILAGAKTGVSYVVKFHGKEKWSPVTAASLPPADWPTGSPGEGKPSLIRPKRIYTSTVGGQLYVGVDGEKYDPERPGWSGLLYAAVSQWNVTADSFSLCDTDYPGIALCCHVPGFWGCSAIPDDPAFLLTRKVNFLSFDAAGKEFGQVLDVGCAGGDMRDATVDIQSPPDKYGRNKLFTIENDGNLYQTEPKDSTEKVARYTPVPLLRDLNLAKVQAVHDHKGGTHLFCVSVDKKMYHLAPNAQLPNGYPAVALPIKSGVEWLAMAQNDDGNIELFYAQYSPEEPLIHMTLNQETGAWTEHAIKVQGGGASNEMQGALASGGDKIEEFISYSTDISFTDKAGAQLVNSVVRINASDRTLISVNGASYAVDAVTSASFKTNGAGQLTITQQATGLSVPDLWLHVDDLIPSNQVLVLAQYANGRTSDDENLPKQLQSVETRLKYITGNELAEAKDATGKLLLKDIYREPANAASLAKAFNSCMKLHSKQPHLAALPPFISREGAWTGLHLESTTAAPERNRVVPRPGLPSWSLSFKEESAHYLTHQPHEAQAKLAAMCAAIPASYSDGTPWWSSIGDFLEAVVGGFVHIKDLLVDGVTAAFTFVVGKVTYFFKAVVQYVQDAFDLIESVLAAAYETVANFFERTFEWLGTLFDWKDILRTHDALSYTFKQVLDFIPLAVDDVRKKTDRGLVDFQKDIDDVFRMLKGEAGNSSLGGLAQSNRKTYPAFTHSAANNIVMNGVMNNAGAAKVSSVSSRAFDSAPISSLMKELDLVTGPAMKSPEFSNLQTYMATATSSTDSIFTQSLSQLLDLVQKLLTALVSGVKAVIAAAFDAVATIVKFIHEFLTAEWDIPFITAFYRYITTDAAHPQGSALTLLDLLSLVIAIPTTVFYKVLKGNAPFPDEASKINFEKSFQTETIFNSFTAGDTKGAPGGQVAALGDHFKNLNLAFGIAAAISNQCYWQISAVNDIIPPNTPTPGAKLLALLEFAPELAGSFFGCPWFPWTEIEHKNAEGGAWLAEVFFGTIGDGAFIAYGNAMPETWNDVGVFVSVGLSAVPFVVAAINTFATASHTDRAIKTLPFVADVVKLGRLTPLALNPLAPGVALAVVAGSDVLIGTTVTILMGLKAGGVLTEGERR